MDKSLVDREELKVYQEERVTKYKRFVKLFIVPILASVLFLGVVIGLIIPRLNNIFFELDVISENNVKIDEGNAKLVELQKLAAEISKITLQLEVISKIAPEGLTEVVNFRNKITELITKNSLEAVSQRFSESNIKPEDFEGAVLALQEVPSVFEITGAFANIRNFINELGQVDDFIVVSRMELSTNALTKEEIESNSWDFEIELSKYQFNVEEETLKDVYRDININARVSDEIEEYINKRLETPAE